LLSAISRPAPAVEEPVPSDVLIRIARVYDDSLNGPFEADLAVKDGLIVISSK
jgi:N-acyl-D-aspartate/D-glutamate deacylase